MKLSNETKVGGLVFATTLLVFVFGWVVGIQNPFNSSVSFYVTYDFAGGIEVGSPVRVSGIKVGKVEKIEFFTPIQTSQMVSGASTSDISPSSPTSFSKTSTSSAAGGKSPRQLPRGLSSIKKAGYSAASKEITQAGAGLKEPGSETPEKGQFISPLKIKISVQKEAAVGVRKDSRFYINLAGIIGERYIEITPGNFETPQIQSGDIVAGVNPPRIDQLISQSFDLAGKIKDVIEQNKGDITRSIELLYKLSGNLNKTLSWVDKSALFKTDLSELVENLIAITSDVSKMTKKANSPDGEKTLNLLYHLLWRLEPLDQKAIESFFQKEGVKVKIF